jgi:hypothetical protein
MGNRSTNRLAPEAQSRTSKSPIAQAMGGARSRRPNHHTPLPPPQTNVFQQTTRKNFDHHTTLPAARRSVELIPRESHGAPKLHSRRMNSTRRVHFRPAFAPLRATLSNQISRVVLATSVDPVPLLRNRPALGRARQSGKREDGNVQCLQDG